MLLYHNIYELEFIGEMKDGIKFKGKGKEYFENGCLKYKGEYWNGEWNGKGNEYSDINYKIKYKGEFSKGKWEGKEKNMMGII